jgi:integrase
MAKRPQFEPIETLKGWMVSVPPMMSGNGERSRKYFPKESDAKAFAASLRRQYHQGERGGVIPHALALMAAQAAELLEPFGLTILDAAKAVSAQHASLGSNETFQERYDRFTTTQEAHWRDRYARDMAKLPKWVGEAFMQRRVATITPDVLRAALVKHGAKAESTIKARSMRVSSILNAKGRQKRRVEIEVMDAGQVEAMLEACQSREETRACALLLFAGIRPDVSDGEITRLDWETVGARDIYIPANVSKTKSDRHIRITPRLASLIQGHPSSGPVTPSGWKTVCGRLRRAARIVGKQDITRHTFASNYLAAFGEDATKAAMGHSKGSDTLFRHYRRSVTNEAGEKYFSHALQRPEEASRVGAEASSERTGQDHASGRRAQEEVASRAPRRRGKAEARGATAPT